MLASLVVRLAGAAPALLSDCVENPAGQRQRFLLGGLIDPQLQFYEGALKAVIEHAEATGKTHFVGITRWVCDCGYPYYIADCGLTNNDAEIRCPGINGRPCGMQLGGRFHNAHQGQQKVNRNLVGDLSMKPEFESLEELHAAFPALPGFVPDDIGCHAAESIRDLPVSHFRLMRLLTRLGWVASAALDGADGLRTLRVRIAALSCSWAILCHAQRENNPHVRAQSENWQTVFILLSCACSVSQQGTRAFVRLNTKAVCLRAFLGAGSGRRRQ